MLLRAFAKINLDLRILGRRADGYHELRTVFQTIDWHDTIRIEPAPAFCFTASSGPEDKNNLVVRAVRAFEKRTGIDARVRIHLAKDVPAGAGLGGGSSDAAAVLAGLQRLFGLQLSAADQHDVLAPIGSDVPFFLHGGRCCASGRGDRIEPMVDATDYRLVVIYPGFSVGTREAYSWLTVQDKSNSIEGFYADFVSGCEEKDLINDFERPVFSRYPELAGIRDDLVRSGAFRASLSGSGSVVFGQFRSEPAAMEAASRMRSQRKYAVRLARPLSRSEYFSRMVEI